MPRNDSGTVWDSFVPGLGQQDGVGWRGRCWGNVAQLPNCGVVSALGRSPLGRSTSSEGHRADIGRSLASSRPPWDDARPCSMPCGDQDRLLFFPHSRCASRKSLIPEHTHPVCPEHRRRAASFDRLRTNGRGGQKLRGHRPGGVAKDASPRQPGTAATRAPCT